MKMKSFAVLMMSGLLAASAVYVAPAMADDEPDAQTVQKPGDVGNTPQNNPMPNIGGVAQTDDMNVDSGNNDSNSNNDAGSSNTDSNPSNPDSNSVTNTPSGSTPPNANDQGAPDTATGDDDY